MPPQDAKLKEEVEVRNQADQMVYQSEKTLAEMGDKIPADDKAKVQAGIDKLKETLKGDGYRRHQGRHRGADPGLLRRQREALSAGQSPGQPRAVPSGRPPTPVPAQGGQYYDADYKVVDDDEKNKQ